jgi:Domain of unknown function (DUF4399)
MKSALTAAVLFTAMALAACGPSTPEVKRTASAAGAKVSILEPKNGAQVTSPFVVKFGVEGMTLAPAGTESKHSGHHHILIDTTLKDFDNPIPADDNHKHFGKAQTEASLELKPGKHTLQLLLGDHNHIPHDPVVQSEVITIEVK